MNANEEATLNYGEILESINPYLTRLDDFMQMAADKGCSEEPEDFHIAFMQIEGAARSVRMILDTVPLIMKHCERKANAIFTVDELKSAGARKEGERS